MSRDAYQVHAKFYDRVYEPAAKRLREAGAKICPHEKIWRCLMSAAGLERNSCSTEERAVGCAGSTPRPRCYNAPEPSWEKPRTFRSWTPLT